MLYKKEVHAMAERSATFKATFPDIQTAIRITGAGAGMKIILEIPETELANALGILTMRESVLEVTIVDKGKTPLRGKEGGERTSLDDMLDTLHD